MFEEWAFLISEMVLLIILATLLGVIVGWIVWGRRGAGDGIEAERLRAEIAAKDARIAALEGNLAAAEAEADMAEEAAVAAAAEAVPVAAAAAADMGAHPMTGRHGAAKPASLDAPRGGTADDLKQIRGIGPKLEKLCNALGFYHFDQIAAWSADEIAWVDTNLEGFKGRVSRDDWVTQAKLLAAGGSTEFAARVKDGDVY